MRTQRYLNAIDELDRREYTIANGPGNDLCFKSPGLDLSLKEISWQMSKKICPWRKTMPNTGRSFHGQRDSSPPSVLPRIFSHAMVM